MSIKILASADLHLGKRSSSIDDPQKAPTKYSWHRMIDWAIKTEVDLLLLSGDVIDQDNRYFEAIGHLQTGFEKLKLAGISVYLVAGNHDYDVLPEIMRHESFENVHLLGEGGSWEMKTFSKGEERLQLVGWSFPSRYFREDPLLSFDIDNLAPDIPAIGLLHGDIGGLDAPYAPLRESNFLHKPVDAWVLGHIHKPWAIRSTEPFIGYPGSPHALSPKEEGMHGPLLLEVQGKHQIQMKRVPLSPVRYETLTLDISQCEDEAQLRNKLSSALQEDSHGKRDELEEVAHLVYDLKLIGEHGRLNTLNTWISPIVTDYELQLETHTRVTVRKYIMEVRQKVENMQDLAKLSSPIGVLARSIIALENNASTPFLDQLLEKFQQKKDELVHADVYRPLGTGHENPLDSRKILLRECNRLLGNLVSQQQQKQ